MRSYPQVSLGDLVRAMGVLEASDNTVQRGILQLLGMTSRTPLRRTHLAEGLEQGEQHEVPTVPLPSQGLEDQVRDERRESSFDQSVIPSRLIYHPAPASSYDQEPAWLHEVTPLSAPSNAPGSAAVGVDVQPLFAPSWTRGILAAALSTQAVDGPFDIDGAVAMLATGKLLTRLPRLPRPTTREGAQVLIDMSRGMLPFIQDRERLEEDLRRVLGEHNVQVLRFAACPTRGVGPGAPRTWGTYEPPRPGRPVALVTDLGIGRPPLANPGASVEEWLAFAQTVRRAGCPLLAFVPYASSRIPNELALAVTVIVWDRRTTVGSVRRVVGTVLEARP